MSLWRRHVHMQGVARCVTLASSGISSVNWYDREFGYAINSRRGLGSTQLPATEFCMENLVVMDEISFDEMGLATRSKAR
jgi:hypothetical protein